MQRLDQGKRHRQHAIGIVLVLTALALLGGCGGGSMSPALPPSALTIGTTAVPDAVNGLQYTFQLQASGGTPGTYVWTVTGLPTGLTAGPSGLITGVPTESGSFAVTVEVTSQ